MNPKRRILLINKKFQFKVAFFVVSWMLAFMAFFPTIVKGVIDSLIQNISRKLDAETLKAISMAQDEVSRLQSDIERTLLIFLILMTFVMFLIALFLSHRIAGPVYRVQSALTRWSKGTVEQNIKLRQYDHFKELADAYNVAAAEMHRVRAKNQEIGQKLERLSQELEPRHKTQIQDVIGELQWPGKKL